MPIGHLYIFFCETFISVLRILKIFLLSRCGNSLYILAHRPFTDIASIFFQFVAHIFIFLTVVQRAKDFNVNRRNFFLDIVVLTSSVRNLCQPTLQIFYLVFCFRSFFLLAFQFRSMTSTK